MQPKSVHWGYTQTTIHPCVVNYRCPLPGCDEVVKESVIGISADLKHDAQAAAAFEKSVINHIKERGISFNKVKIFSDGGNHYKSKGSFLLATETDGYKVDRIFF